MGRPSHREELAKHMGRVTRSREWRANTNRDGLWDRMVKLYAGKHYDSDADEDRMVVNMAFATKNVIAPSVAINNPKFTVDAQLPDHAAQAVITEVVLNYLWRTYKYQADFRLAVDDALVAGHGWIKCGYKAMKPKVVKEIPDVDADAEECYGVDDRDETVEGNVAETTKYIAPFGDDDRPFVERVSIFDMFVDPDARNEGELKWIAQRVKRPLADVLVDSRYDAAARTEVASSMNNRDSSEWARKGVEGAPADGKGMSYVNVYEFYDIRKGTVCTFAEGSEERYLIKPQKMPYPFGHPYVMIRNYEVTDQFYPIGDLEQMEVLQRELNATRTQMMNHRKRYSRKTLYDKDAFEPDGIEALASDDDNAMVPVNLNGSQAGQLAGVVAPMPQIVTPPEFYNQSDLITGDIDRVTGVSDYMRGAQTEIRRTATEAAMIQDAANSRAADRLARIEGVLAQIGSRIVMLMQAFMTGERVVRIAGPNAQPIWVQFDRDYIAGQFDFSVEAGSTQPRNESFRRQSALQLVDALAPFIQMGVVDPSRVARQVLQFGFDVGDVDSFLIQGGQQMQPPGAPPQPPQPGMPPQGAPTPPQAPPEEEAPPEGGIPPELLAQLAGQVGYPQAA